ncbi:GntR family transcriptional regulator [Conexibacter woesei]|uniref:Transcriptional regulator, GntR family n=1 Tax=Conexibacter woesei (strain DSM 14684 / CCUG 47730 / CIP 108061 / JCM 11494 / NBRC 100937 / ID131577) TaxID=469383 RepID=D3F0I6_CONWI|nr:GntR family transcriptional regulator [Conexibacter woesei]ADB52046.1 transcriptional regulator, GntR family [Conexibacter woesei DSM 14684]
MSDTGDQLGLGALQPGDRGAAARPATLTDRATDALRGAIVDGRLRAGELYSVAQLAEQLGVSRTPAREALLLLERQGMVRFERNRGARVLESSARDLDEVFALRLLLEVPAARVAAERIDAAGLVAVAAELEAMGAQLDRADEAAFMARDRRFHELLLEAAGNRRLVAIVADLRDHVRLRGASTVGRGRDLRAIYDEHAAIVEALRSGDPDAVAEAMRAHLEQTRKLLVEAAG